MIRWFEHHQVYAPSSKMVARGADLGSPFEDVYFATSDGVRLNGWFFPADKTAQLSHLVFLLLHGNANNISHRLAFYEAWLELGVNVFSIDYRGYGRSGGKPSEEGTYLDAQAAHQWLRQRGFAPRHIIVVGKSLGGGVASELVLREPCGALILQNTFTSIVDLGAELFPWLPVRRMNSIRYDTLARLPRIKIPVLVAHSRDDELVGFHHGEKNFAAANEPKMFLELQGKHTRTIEAGRAHYLRGLEKFLDEYVK